MFQKVLTTDEIFLSREVDRVPDSNKSFWLHKPQEGKESWSGWPEELKFIRYLHPINSILSSSSSCFSAPARLKELSSHL